MGCRIRFLFLFPVLALTGCGTSLPPLRTVEHVDLERFMGDWYVVANIPTFIERDAHNAVESYRLVSDRRVDTRFRFNEGGFDGPVKTYNPTGFVTDDPSNAIWGMQFVWPIRADYRVIHLDAEYTRTVIGRNKRDYLWIMARTPTIADADLERIIAEIGEQGYDVAKIRRVPQRWPESGSTQP